MRNPFPKTNPSKNGARIDWESVRRNCNWWTIMGSVLCRWWIDSRTIGIGTPLKMVPLSRLTIAARVRRRRATAKLRCDRVRSQPKSTDCRCADIVTKIADKNWTKRGILRWKCSTANRRRADVARAQTAARPKVRGHQAVEPATIPSANSHWPTTIRRHSVQCWAEAAGAVRPARKHWRPPIVAAITIMHHANADAPNTISPISNGKRKKWNGKRANCWTTCLSCRQPKINHCDIGHMPTAIAPMARSRFAKVKSAIWTRTLNWLACRSSIRWPPWCMTIRSKQCLKFRWYHQRQMVWEQRRNRVGMPHHGRRPMAGSFPPKIRH